MIKRLSVSFTGAVVLSFCAFWLLTFILANKDIESSASTSVPTTYSLVQFDLAPQQILQNTIYHPEEDIASEGRRISIDDGCGHSNWSWCPYFIDDYPQFSETKFGICQDCDFEITSFSQDIAFESCVTEQADRRNCLTFGKVKFTWKTEDIPKIFRDLPYGRAS